MEEKPSSMVLNISSTTDTIAALMPGVLRDTAILQTVLVASFRLFIILSPRIGIGISHGGFAFPKFEQGGFAPIEVFSRALRASHLPK